MANVVRGSITGLVTPRVISHIALLGAVTAVVFAGAVGGSTPSASKISQSATTTAVQEAATAGIAANVAEATSFIATQDIAATAKELNSQVTLATTDDATLANQQIVATANKVSKAPFSYTVEGGDTLSTIAAKFNITTNTLRWANQLEDEAAIKPGTQLTILPISGINYKVAAGDTAESLAQKFESNAAQILSFNDAEVSGLTPGMSIIIPDGVLPEEAQPAAAPAAPATTRPTQTATTAAPVNRPSVGAGGYARGYCTYYVASRRAVGAWGNANTWYGSAAASGYGVGSVPRRGAVAWTGAGYYGHVAYVESVNGDMVTVSEMNFNGNWNRVTSRTVPASTFRYIY